MDIMLPPDFKEFLKLLNGRAVEYLLIGGYIELLTTISGVDFEACYARRVVDVLDGVQVNLISLDDLKANKKEAGRYKDLDDLEHLS